MSTRVLRENIPWIGFFSTSIGGSKLPSNKDVMKVLFFNLRAAKLNLRVSAKLVIAEVQPFWDKARIPTKCQKNSIAKLEKLYSEWRDLSKNLKAPGKTQTENESAWMTKLDDLFDIAHINALDLTAKEEDKQFLLSQRQKGRPGFMYGIDYTTSLREEKIEERIQKSIKRKEKSDREKVALKETFVLSSSTSGSDTSESNISQLLEEELLIPEQAQQSIEEEISMPTPAKRSRGLQDIMTPKLAACLDTCKISDRKAVHLVIAVVEALEHDVQNYIINKNSIHNAREKIRCKKYAEIKNRLNISELNAICLHWDGKLLPALTGYEKVDRLPIIITSGSTEQLLEVPALNRGTGKEQASAVCKAVCEWGLQDHIKALVFDTTAVNTGRFNGTCITIENDLERQLLWLPCRHHIFEIILRSVFEEKMGKTEGPNVKMFELFRNSWPKINVNNYRSGLEDKDVKKYLKSDAENIILFVNETLKSKQPREDYREFLELTLIFLGEKKRRGNVTFRAPGAVHHARWMAKAIYSLKIFLFRREFNISMESLKALREICTFIIFIYVRVWFCSPSAAQAPYQDFLLLQQLHSYKNIDMDLSRVALQKFSKHLWYLSPEAVALAFFDHNVPIETKAKMVDALNHEYLFGETVKRISIENVDIKGGLEQFVSAETKNFFERFKINQQFLHTNPSTWNEDQFFIEGLKIIKGLKVVNDAAERGVKLVEDYNQLFSKNEEQKQYILQVVSDYRRRYPKCTKELISK